jgi:ankyrin repeat protein
MKTPLLFASSRKDSKSVYNLLGFGAEVNQSDNKGSTPLTEAVKIKNHETVSYLLSWKADVFYYIFIFNYLFSFFFFKKFFIFF